MRLQKMEGVMTNRQNLLLAVVVTGSATGAFFLDLWMPLGGLNATLYSATVLLSLWLPRQRHTYITAVACTVFVVLGLVLSPPNFPFWHGVTNRLASIFLLWSIALSGQFVRQRTERLREQASLLDQGPQRQRGLRLV
jgi:hypothetical protein